MHPLVGALPGVQVAKLIGLVAFWFLVPMRRGGARGCGGCSSATGPTTTRRGGVLIAQALLRRFALAVPAPARKGCAVLRPPNNLRPIPAPTRKGCAPNQPAAQTGLVPATTREGGALIAQALHRRFAPAVPAPMRNGGAPNQPAAKTGLVPATTDKGGALIAQALHRRFAPAVPAPVRKRGAAPAPFGTAFQCRAHVVTFTALAIPRRRILLHRRTGIAVAGRPRRRFATAPAAS